MKKRVFIVHGWGGSPEGACLPWLRNELRKKDLKLLHHKCQIRKSQLLKNG